MRCCAPESAGEQQHVRLRPAPDWVLVRDLEPALGSGPARARRRVMVGDLVLAQARHQVTARGSVSD